MPLLAGLALIVLHRALRGVSYETIWRDILSLQPGQIVRAVLYTVLGYLSLTAYDVLALRYVRHPLTYRRIGLASFISYALSNTVGLALDAARFDQSADAEGASLRRLVGGDLGRREKKHQVFLERAEQGGRPRGAGG